MLLYFITDMTIRIIFFTCILFLTLTISAQEAESGTSPLTLEVSYTGDIVGNFSGGIRKGVSYLGLANLKLGFDTERAHLWKGGQFFINAANAHGGNPSSTLVGDFHTVSNIEAEDITYVHELWYKQTIDRIEIIAGLQDMNADFVSSEHGSIFINSTFGTPSTIADNVPSPIFPFTTAGVSFKWNMTNRSTWKIAAFDGLPTEREHNPFNMKWSFGKEDGVFAVTEFQLKTSPKNDLTGSYRGGIYYHSQLIEPDEENIETKLFRYNYGIYLIADQMIYQESDGNGGLGVFAQIAVSPRAINTHYRYFGLGMSWQGLFRNRNQDKLGFAVTNAGFRDKSKRDETIIEICYKAQLTPNIYIQPDFQYVINPGGTDSSLKNASVGFVRFGLNF